PMHDARLLFGRKSQDGQRSFPNVLNPVLRVWVLEPMRTHTRRQRHTQSGAQHLWGFDNGLLVSVVPDTAQEHHWEITVLDGSGRLAGNATAGREVIGCFRAIEIRRVLRQIEATP